MKKLMTLILVLCMTTGLFCLAGAEDPEPVTAAELAAWAESLKKQALEGELLNDPTDENAEMEDGFMLVYPFATLYADSPEMNENTKIAMVSVEDADDIGFRGLLLTMMPAEAAALFPNDNPDMAGEREDALLYLTEEADGGVLYGWVYRDGQRIQSIEYGHIAPVEGGYRRSRLNLLFAENLLFAVTAEGLNSEAGLLLTEEDKDAITAEMAVMKDRNEYTAVKMSRTGDAPEFTADDLIFAGIDFLAAQPEDMPGVPEQEEIEDEEGSLLRVDGDGYIAVFRVSADGTKEIVSFSIEHDELEGPRGVRLGDTFQEDIKRFRMENRDSDGLTEMLYGEEDGVPRGVAEFGGEENTLRYVTAAPDGRNVELLLRYTMNELTEILVHVL